MILKRDKKDEEDGVNPFVNLDKATVLQEARTFNETPINNRKCTTILTKIIFILNQGRESLRQEWTAEERHRKKKR